MQTPLKIACIDLEGVLSPEIWPFVARQTAIPALSLTTREVPDYPALMQRRIGILRENSITLHQLQAMAAMLEPLPGAVEFLDVVRQYYDVRIVSDCFHEIADGIVARLGCFTAMCHRFLVDGDGFISGCDFSPRRGKEDVVIKFIEAGATVLAVGDAFNDIAMLESATYGFLLNPSPQTRAAAPHLRVVEHFDEIVSTILHQENPYISAAARKHQKK